MYGKFPNYLNKDHVDVELSFQWMEHTGLKGETEGLITAVQDQALNTRYYSKHIIKQGNHRPDAECQGAKTLAVDQYLNRHNQAAAQSHLDIWWALWHPNGSRVLVST